MRASSTYPPLRICHHACSPVLHNTRCPHTRTHYNYPSPHAPIFHAWYVITSQGTPHPALRPTLRPALASVKTLEQFSSTRPWGVLARLLACVSVSSRTEGSYTRPDIRCDTLISTPSGAVEGAGVICILGEHHLASPRLALGTLEWCISTRISEHFSRWIYGQSIFL